MNVIRIPAFLPGWLVVIVCGMESHLAMQEMVGDVNRVEPHDEFLQPGWYYTKQRRLIRAYCRLFPTGSRLRRARNVGTGGAVGLAIMAIAVGFPPIVSLIFATGVIASIRLVYGDADS